MPMPHQQTSGYILPVSSDLPADPISGDGSMDDIIEKHICEFRLRLLADLHAFSGHSREQQPSDKAVAGSLLHRASVFVSEQHEDAAMILRSLVDPIPEDQVSDHSSVETPPRPSTVGADTKNAEPSGRKTGINEFSDLIAGSQARLYGGSHTRLHRLLSKPSSVKDAARESVHAYGRSKFDLREGLLDSVMGVIIALNAVQIGISCDLRRDWVGWQVVDGGFALIFLIELLTKLRMHGCRGYFCGQTWKWNLFDSIVVALASVELLLSALQGDNTDGVNLSFLRIIRLCRLARLMRLTRLAFFKDLLMMVDGMIGGLRTLFWSVVLLLAPLYAVAILLRETLGQNTGDADLTKPFMTLSWSFFTIFRCVMGDCSSERGTPIFVLVTQQFGWVYGAFYVTLVVLTSIGLFNVISAIFVENTLLAAKVNDVQQEWKRLADETRTSGLLNELVEILVLALSDPDQERLSLTSGMDKITLEAAENMDMNADLFHRVMARPQVQGIFDMLDIAKSDRIGLFDILDADNSGSLSIGEIINGIVRLRGTPRRSDIIANGLVIRSMQDNFHNFELQVDQRLRAFDSILQDLKLKLP